MKSQQPELWSPPPSSSTSTSSLSGEDVDAQELPPYDSEELQYPSSDSDLRTGTSGANSAETSSQDPPSPSRQPHVILSALKSSDKSLLHHRTDSGSSTDPDMDFCIVERTDHDESLDEQTVPSSATQFMDQESVRATATVPDSKATGPQERKRHQSVGQVQSVAGEQGTSPSLLLPSLLDYDAVLTTTKTTTITTSATKEATRLDSSLPIRTSRRLNFSPAIITRTSQHTDKETSLSRHKRRFAQESQFFMLAVLGAIGVSVLLILGIAFIVSSVRSTNVQPSHALLRHVDYASDGLMGIAHIDLYTSKGTPFMSKRVYPFHARVDFGDRVKNWTPQATSTAKLSDSKAPFILDLGNGTYQLYIQRPLRAHYQQHQHQQDPSQDQREDQHRAPTPRLKSWLCPGVSQYYLHLWFENGTRVPDTPHRLEWSTAAAPLHRKDSLKTGTTTLSESHHHHYPSSTYSTSRTGSEENHQHGHEQGAIALWTNGLQPVLCELYRISEAMMSFTFLMSQVVLSLVSHSVDRLFGVEDWMHTHVVASWMRAKHNSKHLVSKALSLCEQTKRRVSMQDPTSSPSPSPSPTSSSTSAASASASDRESTALMVLLDQQVKSLTRAMVRVNIFAAGIQQLPATEKVLETADKILVVVEDHVVKMVKSKRVQKIAEQVQAHDLFLTADRVFLRTEQEVERLFKTEFAQDVNQRVRRKMQELQATPRGERWSHRLQALRAGVNRRWARFQTSLSQDD